MVAIFSVTGASAARAGRARSVHAAAATAAPRSSARRRGLRRRSSGSEDVIALRLQLEGLLLLDARLRLEPGDGAVGHGQHLGDQPIEQRRVLLLGGVRL